MKREITKYTYEKFISDYTRFYAAKHFQMRDGQFLMNFLFDIWPKEYHRITNTNTTDTKHIDCFYNDKWIPNTLKHLEKVWHKYPY